MGDKSVSEKILLRSKKQVAHKKLMKEMLTKGVKNNFGVSPADITKLDRMVLNKMSARTEQHSLHKSLMNEISNTKGNRKGKTFHPVEAVDNIVWKSRTHVNLMNEIADPVGKDISSKAVELAASSAAKGNLLSEIREGVKLNNVHKKLFNDTRNVNKKPKIQNLKAKFNNFHERHTYLMNEIIN